jgi:hypothetical protein
MVSSLDNPLSYISLSLTVALELRALNVEDHHLKPIDNLYNFYARMRCSSETESRPGASHRTVSCIRLVAGNGPRDLLDSNRSGLGQAKAFSNVWPALKPLTFFMCVHDLIFDLSFCKDTGC